MSTWRRRALSVLPRGGGISRTDLGDDVALVGKSAGSATVQPLSDEAWLVQSGTGRATLSVDALDAGTWLVRAGEGEPGHLQQVSGDAWLVQSGRNARAPLTVEEVDERTWVVQRGRDRRRTVKPIGREKLRLHLLVDEQAARRGMKAHQMALSHYLAAEHISWILRELRINCVLDVGANIGQYGQRLRSGGYEGRIVSFEPLPHTAERLREVAADDPDWRVVECALGDTEGAADMNVVDGRGATSSLLSPSEFGKSWSSRLEGVRREQVRIRRLDDVFDDAVAGLDSPRVYLKLDTQGYDLKAFAGAGDRIRDVQAMQSEISNVPIYEGMPRLPEQIATYEGAGFEATEMFPVTRDRETLRAIEFDVVMVRPEARSGLA